MNTETLGKERVRKSAVAGLFYPADPVELKETVIDYLLHARNNPKLQTHKPKAIIAPHAGYIYSGPIAASAYHYLEQMKDQIANVVLIGPSHRVPLMGLATTSADYFATPLGNIPINREITERINSLPFVVELDHAHMMEHSLEVHLPFLQIVLNNFSLVPVVAGDATADQVKQLISLACDKDDTFVVISSDLSHYHDYYTARKLDHATCSAIEALDINQLDSQHACGFVPVSGLLAYAREHKLQAKTVDCRNSGDTAGSKDQVVGYGSYVFI